MSMILLGNLISISKRSQFLTRFFSPNLLQGRAQIRTGRIIEETRRHPPPQPVSMIQSSSRQRFLPKILAKICLFRVFKPESSENCEICTPPKKNTKNKKNRPVFCLKFDTQTEWFLVEFSSLFGSPGISVFGCQCGSFTAGICFPAAGSKIVLISIKSEGQGLHICNF